MVLQLGMRYLYLIFAIGFVISHIQECESRGGGRGGGRGGFRGGRGRGGGRYSRLSYRANARAWTNTKKVSAFRTGSIYIAPGINTYYYRSYTYDYNKAIFDLRICRNTVRFPKENASQEVYGWFICPESNPQAPEKYCCGDENKEYCCKFWDSPEGTSRIVGIVFSIIGAIGLLIYFGCKYPDAVAAIFAVIAAIICFPCVCISQLILSCRKRARRRSPPTEEPVVTQPERRNSTDIPQETTNVMPPSYDECLKNEDQFVTVDDVQLENIQNGGHQSSA